MLASVSLDNFIKSKLFSLSATSIDQYYLIWGNIGGITGGIVLINHKYIFKFKIDDKYGS